MIDFRQIDGQIDFYFLRHGESQGNDARVIQGRSDYPLSENGRRQALQAAEWFKDKKIDVILCSPLARAHETAKILCQSLGAQEVQLREGLNELNTGLFTGLTVAEIQSRHPEEWRSFQRYSWEGVPGAESIAALAGRAEKLWEELAPLSRKSRRILCVTHSGIMQWLIKTTFGHRSWMPVVPMGNCGICRFSVDNRLHEEPVRYYSEWSLLNYQPFRELEQEEHLFLKR